MKIIGDYATELDRSVETLCHAPASFSLKIEREETSVKSWEMTSPVDETLNVQMDNGQTLHKNGTLTPTLQTKPRKPAHYLQYPVQEVSLLSISQPCRKSEHYL